MADCFPRTKDMPAQSPVFWVNNKDRYLRQQLIKDIEEDTGRRLIVYFTDCDRSNANIDLTDDVAIAELLTDCKDSPVDLLLETNGGMTDATEKICSLLRQTTRDLRVIVPRKAKSNGTVIALCGTHVLMSATSELGPIDPSIFNMPAEFIIKAKETFNPIDIQHAVTAQLQTRKLATALLKTGMMSSYEDNDIDATVAKMASREHYHSHGSTIDADEAKSLGLRVLWFEPTDYLWQKIWLLRTMYQYDCGVQRYDKLFESKYVSSAVSRSSQN